MYLVLTTGIVLIYIVCNLSFVTWHFIKDMFIIIYLKHHWKRQHAENYRSTVIFSTEFLTVKMCVVTNTLLLLKNAVMNILVHTYSCACLFEWQDMHISKYFVKRGRQNNTPPKRRLHPDPQNLWIYYVTWQGERN